MQGAGNDFIVVNNMEENIPEELWSHLAVRLCARRLSLGADGLMIEVHNNPKCALCDGAQSLDPAQFDHLMQDVRRRVEFEGKALG